MLEKLSKPGPKPAHIPAEKLSKTETRKQKPNKPARHQGDRNIAKPENQQASNHANEGADGKGEALRYKTKCMP